MRFLWDACLFPLLSNNDDVYRPHIISLLRHTSTEVLLGGCRLMNLDPDKVVVDGVDDLEICTSRSA